tara:strand:- start:153 stop:509 length:357 start_codon:yes stop_codon:yes gene_type:complete
MRFIAVLGVLFVLASCSDSDIEDLEFSCVANKLSPPNFILFLKVDMSMIKLTNTRTYFFYPYFESPDDIYFLSYPPEYLNSDFEDIEIIFNKEKSSMKVRENTIFRERIEFSGCEQIK